MLDNTNAVKASIKSSDVIIKEFTQDKSSHKSLSSALKLVQTEVNQFLTSLINEPDEEIEDYDSASEKSEGLENEDELDNKRATGIKRAEQTTNASKKVKKT